MDFELKKPSQIFVQVPGFRNDKFQSLPFCTDLSGIQFLIGDHSDTRKYFLECIFDLQFISKYWASSEYPRFIAEEIPIWLQGNEAKKIQSYIQKTNKKYFILVNPENFNIESWLDFNKVLIENKKWLWISLDTIPKKLIHSFRVSYCRKYNDGNDKIEVWGPFQQGSFLREILYLDDKQNPND